MSAAARLILAGLLLVLAAVAAYAMVDWDPLLERYAQYLAPLKNVLRHALDLAWYMALGLPAVLVAGSFYRFVVAKSGRTMIVARLFAWFTLWAIGSFAFFVTLFLTYAPDLGEGGDALVVPALIAIAGYLVIGLGFIVSVLRR